MHGMGAVALYLPSQKSEGKCKESQEIVFVLAFKRKSSFNITQISFYLWNMYECFIFRSYSIRSLRLWSNVVCLLLLMCRVGKWQWIPRAAAAAAVETSHFLEVCRLAKQTLCQSQISWCDSSTPSSNWEHLSSSLALIQFGPGAPPAVRWQLTIASSPLINCWNDTPSHKQCIILGASETLRSAIVGAKYASTYHSKQVESTVGYWVCCMGMEGGWLCLACKFQSRLRYPSGAPADSQNQFGEGGLASTFLCFCFHLSLPFSHSHSSLRSLSLSSSSLLLIHLPLSLLSLALSPPVSMWLFFFPLSPPLYPLSFSTPAIKL